MSDELAIENPWAVYGFHVAATAEDVDACVDRMLDAIDAGSQQFAPGATLSALFGMLPEQFDGVVGDVMASDVALVRAMALEMALSVCAAEAQNVANGCSAQSFTHALAVCGCLQFESLGEIDASQQSFAAINKALPNAQDYAIRYLSACGCGPDVALAFVRYCLKDGVQTHPDVILALSTLRPIEVMQPVTVTSERHHDDVLSVQMLMEAMRDCLAVSGEIMAQERIEAQEPACVGYGGQMLLAVQKLAEKTGGGLQSALAHRLSISAGLPAFRGVNHLCSLSNAALPPQSAEAVWRQLSAIPALQVVGPFLSVPSYVFGRMGPTGEVDALSYPLLRQLIHMPEREEEIQSRLMAAAGIAAVLAYLTDQGIVTGTLPSDPTVRAGYERSAGRAEDCIRCDGQLIGFDRNTGLGMLLGSIADIATLLAYQSLDDASYGAETLSPLGWLGLPLHDDPRFDLASAIVLTIASRLDVQVLSELMQVMYCVSVPETRQAPAELAALLQNSRVCRRSEPQMLKQLIAKYWDQTAGLGANMPARVNGLGQAVGRPLGGAMALPDIWAVDHGYAGKEAKLLSDHAIEAAMPSHTIAGQCMTEAAYWKYAKRRGDALRDSLGTLLKQTPILNTILSSDDGQKLARSLVSYLALKSDEVARRDAFTKHEAGTGLMSNLS